MFDFLSWGDYGQLVLSINNVAIVLPKIYIFSETKYLNSCSDIVGKSKELRVMFLKFYRQVYQC